MTKNEWINTSLIIVALLLVVIRLFAFETTQAVIVSNNYSDWAMVIVTGITIIYLRKNYIQLKADSKASSKQYGDQKVRQQQEFEFSLLLENYKSSCNNLTVYHINYHYIEALQDGKSSKDTHGSEILLQGMSVFSGSVYEMITMGETINYYNFNGGFLTGVETYLNCFKALYNYLDSFKGDKKKSLLKITNSFLTKESTLFLLGFATQFDKSNELETIIRKYKLAKIDMIGVDCIGQMIKKLIAYDKSQNIEELQTFSNAPEKTVAIYYLINYLNYIPNSELVNISTIASHEPGEDLSNYVYLPSYEILSKDFYRITKEDRKRLFELLKMYPNKITDRNR